MSNRINNNCLQGYRCPKCTSTRKFTMTTICDMPWEDEGTDFAGNPEIVLEGTATCADCRHTGPTKTFDIEQQYIAEGGTKCPYCNGEDLEGSSVEVSNWFCYQRVGCLDCEMYWDNIYKLVNIGDFPNQDAVTELNEKADTDV